MKIQVQTGQNQGTKIGSTDFILSVLKWQSQVIQKTQEGKIGGADTCNLCHRERSFEVPDALIATCIKLKQAKNLSWHAL